MAAWLRLRKFLGPLALRAALRAFSLRADSPVALSVGPRWCSNLHVNHSKTAPNSVQNVSSVWVSFFFVSSAMTKSPNHRNACFSNIKLLFSECPRSSSYQFFIRKSFQNEAQNGANMAQKLYPKLHQKSVRKMSALGLQNGAQIWNKTCPEITSKLYEIWSRK